MSTTFSTLHRHITIHLEVIYSDIDPPVDTNALATNLLRIMNLDTSHKVPEPEANHWDQTDVVLITYGDTIIEDTNVPLHTLYDFLNKYCSESINSVHILPFFPYSSDDGFSVIDYKSINQSLGEWEDIERISKKFRLMADLVINHCSSRSEWFKNFINCEGQGADFFTTADPEHDHSMVIRPRTSPLLRPTKTKDGMKYVWCTFSHDQVDLDFKNTEVLCSFVSIIRLYLDMGVSLFRLDAVAFLWKEVSTTCLNLPQTHEVVRLLRTLIEHAQSDAIVITETNIPVQENLSYFGDNNEANWVYNFPLPPLLINSLITENCHHLRKWLMSMPPAYNGTAYFNFIASHDGVGLRPVEGILLDSDLENLVKTMQMFGGEISWRTSDHNSKKAYELNISLFDALQGTTKGKDDLGIERFICAHSIMFGLEGVPGIYIHSLLGTTNDYENFSKTGENRSINRHKWHFGDLEKVLKDKDSHHYQVLSELNRLLNIRKNQIAFHPNATQFTLQLRDEFLGVWRQSINRKQSIFAVSNVTSTQQDLTLATLNIIENQKWYDLVNGEEINTTIPIIHFAPYQTRWISNIANISL